jgi:hypothetical protein
MGRDQIPLQVFVLAPGARTAHYDRAFLDLLSVSIARQEEGFPLLGRP